MVSLWETAKCVASCLTRPVSLRRFSSLHDIDIRLLVVCSFPAPGFQGLGFRFRPTSYAIVSDKQWELSKSNARVVNARLRSSNYAMLRVLRAASWGSAGDWIR